MKLKLATIAGTRPEIIRLSEILKKCDQYFEHTLIHTGQNYDYALNQVFFEELGLRAPDRFLEVASADLGQTIGHIIARSYAALAELAPEALLVLGDTNSALSVIAAKRLKIPVFHLEAGNRCFDENLPEEINRRLVDHLADVNLCYSEAARRHLLREGRPPERTMVVGSPLAEVLTAHLPAIENSPVLDRLGLVPCGYILLSAHREENIDQEANFLTLMAAVNALAEHYGRPIVYSVHPRSAKAIAARGFRFHPLVDCRPPFGFFDYNQLQRRAFCVVSDSGTLAEEASFFGFPAVSIRTSTERPEALEKGNFILGGLTEKEVLRAVDLAVTMNEKGAPVPDYVDLNVSAKVVKIIQSCARQIDLLVWRKTTGPGGRP